MHFRRMMLILAALAGAITFVPSSAAARGRGGWGRGRGFGWSGAAVGVGLGLGFVGRGYVGPSGVPIRAYNYGDGCWRRAVVETPYGPRIARVWFCD